MTLAIRGLVTGFCLSTVLWYYIDPPIPVLVITLLIGHVIGFASAYFGDWLEWLLCKFDDEDQPK